MRNTDYSKLKNAEFHNTPPPARPGPGVILTELFMYVWEINRMKK